MKQIFPRLQTLSRACFAAMMLAVISAQADPVLSSWVPKFKGVDYAAGTNTPSKDLPHLQAIYALRVDLTDPDIRLLTTPRIDNYAEGTREGGGLTVSDFLKTHHLQAALNANFFSPGEYYLPPGTPMDISGLAVSEGVVVSPADRSHAATITFDTNNQPAILYTNWPAASLDGVFTAISGDSPLVIAGKNITTSSRFDTDPRTAYGLSQDRHYLYMLAIDGRQPGYSEGASDYETAEWLLLLGAYDGINVDGGGSTTLVIEDSTGVPIRLNRSSAVADSGRERTVGSHFGLFAKPLPGFINDIAVSAEDTTADISWTTVQPATTETQYGLTTDFGATSGIQSALTTNHAVHLTGLTANTGYYFKAISTVDGQEYASSNYYFTTTNYVTTNQIFGITNAWKFNASNLDGIHWTDAGYDDSSWNGSGPGLLWADVRAAGPNPSVDPKNTEMPSDPGTGYPYVTYYFRTHFTLSDVTAGGSLAFSAYVDDGAVFYINGTEVYRLRMPAAADAETLAISYPCDGDATCPDAFSVPVDSIPNLSTGDNVLAVEVHNYNLRSSDATFGMSLSQVEPQMRAPKIEIQRSGLSIALNWQGAGFTLQSASSPEGPWQDIQGTAASPFVTNLSDSNQFYRLRR